MEFRHVLNRSFYTSAEYEWSFKLKPKVTHLLYVPQYIILNTFRFAINQLLTPSKLHVVASV